MLFASCQRQCYHSIEHFSSCLLSTFPLFLCALFRWFDVHFSEQIVRNDRNSPGMQPAEPFWPQGLGGFFASPLFFSLFSTPGFSGRIKRNPKSCPGLGFRSILSESSKTRLPDLSPLTSQLSATYLWLGLFGFSGSVIFSLSWSMRGCTIDDIV